MEGFTFRRFKIIQDRCAMKVGTDGVLLGAWANGGNKILDIGTGTALIALMMAQRFEQAKITAIDIDEMACGQAKENVDCSPFSDRIEVACCALQDFKQDSFDAIATSLLGLLVEPCNPPKPSHSQTFAPRKLIPGGVLTTSQDSFQLFRSYQKKRTTSLRPSIDSI